MDNQIDLKEILTLENKIDQSKEERKVSIVNLLKI